MCVLDHSCESKAASTLLGELDIQVLVSRPVAILVDLDLSFPFVQWMWYLDGEVFLL